MTILSIETSTSVCSAAICKDGEPINQCICREGSNHARLLPLYIQQLLTEAQQQGLTIDAVALSEGPGSYTGLRIGTSTAKGLCYGLNVPLIPVPTLEMLCEAAKEQSAVSLQPSDILLPMIDARRMEVYTAVNGETKAVVVENEDSFSVSGEVYYFGDGAEKCSKVFTKPNWHYIPDIVPEARFVGALAQTKAAKGEGLKANEIAYYEPYYLKEFIAAPSHVKGLQ
ncbi:MAG: tRNA (adenosine(37)-N6)-threonylcarbamoyltransferase complex dimerization subunit type 1 TsaB [Paludibacteraceae bacterium]|nr:tRNA (adenosine(37)-N6)-threonylcarbamoyltransferase complex dimerization subunit type 1 TsaB [Paludibacteraceae bacterium]